MSVLAASLGVRLAFWLSTHWTIEDALIIGRMVRNLVERGDLSFNVGERVSAATSPLFALLVSGLAWLGFEPLAAAKVLGLLASTATCLYVFDLLCGFTSPIAAAFASCVCVALPPIIASSVAGLETALYTLVSCCALERLVRGRLVAALVCGSLALLVRPDGMIVLLVVLVFVMGRLKWDLRRTLSYAWPMLLLVPAGVALHALYYNSLLPHSAVAKATAYHVVPSLNVLHYLQRMFLTWTGGLVIYVMALIGALRLRDRARSLVPFVVWYVVYHLCFMFRAPLFDWYLHPPLAVLALFAGVGLLTVPEYLLPRERKRPLWVEIAPGAVVAAALLAILPVYTRSKARMQAYEYQVRAEAGVWLSMHSSPEALVFTESLGYIGYHAPNRFVDWPGLASRNVPELLKGRNIRERIRGYELIILHYRPDYLALRVSEWWALSPGVRARFSVCADFPTPSDELGPAYLIAGISCS